VPGVSASIGYICPVRGDYYRLQETMFVNAVRAE